MHCTVVVIIHLIVRYNYIVGLLLHINITGISDSNICEHNKLLISIQGPRELDLEDGTRISERDPPNIEEDGCSTARQNSLHRWSTRSGFVIYNYELPVCILYTDPGLNISLSVVDRIWVFIAMEPPIDGRTQARPVHRWTSGRLHIPIAVFIARPAHPSVVERGSI